MKGLKLSDKYILEGDWIDLYISEDNTFLTFDFYKNNLDVWLKCGIKRVIVIPKSFFNEN